MKTISTNDPRHAAAQNALDAMQAYFDLIKHDPDSCAVRWIEDTRGRVIVFTRGEYRDRMMNSINENIQPTAMFEQELIMDDCEDTNA